MADIKVKRRADGKWVLADDPDQVFEAKNEEEAERLAKAYLEKHKSGAKVVKTVARSEQDKAKSRLI